jgi:GT2 family glycosyltransferase
MKLSVLWLRGSSAAQRAYLVWRQEGLAAVTRKGMAKLRAWRASSSVHRASRSSLAGNLPSQARAEPWPDVSVVIPVFNGVTFVRQCLESIFASADSVRFEVIVIDQNSRDGARKMLRTLAARHSNMILIENATNVGFTRAVNQGSAVARGEYLAICNSDVVATPGWLDRLVDPLRRDPQLAVVSPLTNYVGEGPQLDSDARAVTPETAADYAARLADRVGVQPVVDRLVFFCVLVRKSAFDLLGGLSDAYGMGNYEDDDFCMRARLAGFTLALVPSAFVFHYGSRTFQEQKVGHVGWMIRNEGIFFERLARLSSQSILVHRAIRSDTPQVSVIVRTKDRPSLLRAALTSLSNQTLPDFEVVVVNDGGGPIGSLLEFFEPYLRISAVEHGVSRGRSAALNAGLAAAKGRWITYLDDDDIVYPSHLENLVTPLQQDGKTMIAYSDANKALCWVDKDGEQLVVVQRTRFAQQPFDAPALLVDNWIPILSVMHSADCISEGSSFDPGLDMFEDWDMLIRLARRVEFHHVPRITCEYRFRFGMTVDDSTLHLREKALEARLDLYHRYPVPQGELSRRRDQAVEFVRQQIHDIRRISALDVDQSQKSLLLAARLGGFSLPG